MPLIAEMLATIAKSCGVDSDAGPHRRQSVRLTAGAIGSFSKAL
jgi:hypothetical protein